MKKKSILAVVMISILTLMTSIGITQYPLPTFGDTYNNIQTEKAVNYLTNFMFVPSVGLDRCSPIAESNTIWLTNDNILAYVVLLNFNTSMAETLNQNLAKYNVSGNGLVEVVLNKTIEPIRASNSYNVTTIGQYTIKMDIRNGSVMQDFNQYADLCFWWSQNLLLKNDVNGAIDYFNQGMSMWNGTGFLDVVYNSSQTKEFQTFKVGLALWMAERLNCTINGNLHQQTSFTEADYSEMHNIIWTLQDPTNGGIHTGYTSTFGNITSDTDTNVETTSICLLYQSVPQPIPPPPTPTASPTTPPQSATTSTQTQTRHPTPSPTTPELSTTLLVILIVGVSMVILYKKKTGAKNTTTSRLP
jgi:hypothetical protein